MANGCDFDFKIGDSQFRGRGCRALIALAIFRWRWPAVMLGGAYSTFHAIPPWLWDLAHRFTGW